MGDEGTSGPTHTAGTGQGEDIKQRDGRSLDARIPAHRTQAVGRERKPREILRRSILKMWNPRR